MAKTLELTWRGKLPIRFLTAQTKLIKFNMFGLLFFCCFKGPNVFFFPLNLFVVKK